MKRMICVILALGMASLMYADMGEIHSQSKLDHLLRKRELVVALFYKSDRDTRKSEELASNIAALERIFKHASEEDRYKDAKIMFVKINIANAQAEDLAAEYDIQTLPTVILFKDGSVVHTAGRNSSIAQKRGFVRGQALQLFIDEYLGETINTYVQMNAERKRRKERTSNFSTYVGFGYGYGPYPYYGYYGYPYVGGSVGFGYSF
jgi:hypothetical protein